MEHFSTDGIHVMVLMQYFNFWDSFSAKYTRFTKRVRGSVRLRHFDVQMQNMLAAFSSNKGCEPLPGERGGIQVNSAPVPGRGRNPEILPSVSKTKYPHVQQLVAGDNLDCEITNRSRFAQPLFIKNDMSALRSVLNQILLANSSQRSRALELVDTRQGEIFRMVLMNEFLVQHRFADDFHALDKLTRFGCPDCI